MDSLVNDLVSHYRIGRFRISALPAVYGKALRFYSKNYEARRFDRNHMVMIVNVPVEDLKNAVMKSTLAKGFNSFNDYLTNPYNLYSLKTNISIFISIKQLLSYNKYYLLLYLLFHWNLILFFLFL